MLCRSLPRSIAVVLLLATISFAQSNGSNLADAYRVDADRIIDAALADSAAYERLALLTDLFGHRFSGSQSLEDALDWILEEMQSDGLENVRSQEVLVPRWVRGRESIEIVSPRPREVPMLGLGGSVGTPEGGIEAEVLVVSGFDDLKARAAEAHGKIVLFNVPFTSYGETVAYRRNGAPAAARAGAVASMIRSVGPYSIQTPHTGSMRYEDDIPKIPHAAITAEDAKYMQRLADRGETVVVRLNMDAQMHQDVMSRNVIAEIVGSQYPDEVIVMGGHIDSWDVGAGAMDDGGGCVAAWEALRIIKDLGLRPKRTIRVVLWTNEENGLRGARAYRDSVALQIDNHILAIESDGGVFKPSGFGFSGTDEAMSIMLEIGSLLDRIEAGEITPGGGGADIGPLMRDGVPGMGLSVDRSKYFWYHHTHADTIDKLDPYEVGLSTATMAVAAYVVADMPERLPRAPRQP